MDWNRSVASVESLSGRLRNLVRLYPNRDRESIQLNAFLSYRHLEYPVIETRCNSGIFFSERKALFSCVKSIFSSRDLLPSSINPAHFPSPAKETASTITPR